MLTPIFGWGKNRAALKAKKAAYEAEVHSYEKAVLEAVSYTHLDVYKRQLYAFFLQRIEVDGGI